MSSDITPILKYQTSGGKIPFDTWFAKLDSRSQEAIDGRLTRMQFGHFADVKSVGAGVLEARFHFGSGYRVYFGMFNGTMILLLMGGDKSTQTADIKKAKLYFKDAKGRQK